MTDFRQFYEDLDWHTESVSDCTLVLGDCGPMFLDSEGQITGPIGICRADEACGTLMPISSTQIAIGVRNGLDVAPTGEAMNLHVVAWSLSAFVSSSPPERIGPLIQELGKDVDSYLATLDPFD